MRKLIFFLVLLTPLMVRSQIVPDYKNAKLPVDKRVADLLSRMTLDEKVAQMTCVWHLKKELLLNASGNFDEAKASSNFQNGIGQVGRPSDAGTGKTAKELAELTNAIQRFFLEKTRLGIPVIFHEESLHGLAAKEATNFPQPIALASSWDKKLVEQIYTTAALEARSRGIQHVLTPVVDVARDPRWGRVEETYGEDPFLVSQMGISAVRGFQGTANFADGKHVMATLKHFAAHGQPESGANCAPANYSERILREVFLYPFKKVIQEAGAVSVMASYNEIDGVPSHANKWLLNDVLRKEWGFKGFVVSDYYAITELFEREDFKKDLNSHTVNTTFMAGNHVAGSKQDAALLAVKAGVNIELPEPDCYSSIPDLVKKGLLKESELDALIAPMLAYKFQFGLFENPYVDVNKAVAISTDVMHDSLAKEAALKSVVLLKNENGLLPLQRNAIQRVAVIGPNANRVLVGGYSGTPKYFVTVKEGIERKLAGKAIVSYSEGCKITVGGNWDRDSIDLPSVKDDELLMKEAEMVAAKSDVIVLAIGGNEQTSREAWAPNHMGDRTSLDLIGRQNELVKRMLATGKPVVVLLFNGSPLSFNYVQENVPAILECWYLGQESGNAIADILFGDYNPGGKLPITFPRSVGHIPAYYNHKPFARRGYLFDEVSPLYSFGYGLSYSKFVFSDLKLAKNNIAANETTSVSVVVTNTSKVKGTETAQLYIRDQISSVTRPVKELKGFEKVLLNPGESKTVTFQITPELLSFYNIDMKYGVEPGRFSLMVGNSCADKNMLEVALDVH